MNKEFVPYEVALRMKDLGFNEPCLAYYYNEKNFRVWGTRSGIKNSFWPPDLDVITAPLFQQAFDFFREKHKLSGIPTHQSYDVWNLGTGECFIEEYPIESYEKAQLACLRKLIEIVKEGEK